MAPRIGSFLTGTHALSGDLAALLASKPTGVTYDSHDMPWPKCKK